MQLPCSCRLASQRQRVRVAHGGTRRLTGESALTYGRSKTQMLERLPLRRLKLDHLGARAAGQLLPARMINTRLYLSAERNHLCRPLYHTTLYSIEA